MLKMVRRHQISFVPHWNNLLFGNWFYNKVTGKKTLDLLLSGSVTDVFANGLAIKCSSRASLFHAQWRCVQWVCFLTSVASPILAKQETADNIQKSWSHPYLLPFLPNFFLFLFFLLKKTSFQIQKIFTFSFQVPNADGKCNGLVTERLQYKSCDPRRRRADTGSSAVPSYEASCSK